ncbi:aspartyl-phosphate phosphatase Spo0E family protein [Priestia filamentosa]|uniref:aspartyl-phosphate phosphatase Spo0E family protein n=1 Tax=Priestia filamentosa TaxID=1402861 RepID=UPI001C1E2194|nr:aspartyl-phosphate phosphatase Spo0E family protein [Priestia filamentosa]
MILREALDLSKSIANYRLDMYELARNKSFSDPDVIKVSQQLDSKILAIQKSIHELRSS